MKGPDLDKLLHFLSFCILAFINEGSTFLSNSFTNEPWSWALGIPISLYLKFALELHAHLGISMGVGLPSLVYWGATRNPIDWYWEAVLEFNIEFLKTGCFNLVIGLAHYLASKLVHRILEWVKDHKVLSSWTVISKLEASLSEFPLLRPIPATDMLLQMSELLSVFFCNGNVLLLSWSFSGQKYSSDVGKAISWVSLGSTLFVWMKALLKQLLEVPQAPPEEKAYKVEKDHSSIPGIGSKDQASCLSEC